MSLCSLSASFIRAHKAVPGLSGARRNTRGFHSVNRGLVPNSAWHLISHARPRLPPSPHEHSRYRCSLSLFLLLLCVSTPFRHSLCLSSTASSGSVGHRRFLVCSCVTPLARLPPSNTVPFLLCLSSISDPDRRRTTAILPHRILPSLASVAHRRVGVPAC